MKGLRFLKGIAVSLSVWGIVIPQANLVSAGPNKQLRTRRSAKASSRLGASKPIHAPKIADVALSAGGTLSGLVIDGQGHAVDGAAVSIRRGTDIVARTVSNKSGLFTVSNLHGGLYHVTAGDGQGLFRFWAPKTAPPSARAQALVISDSRIVRGQDYVEDENGNIVQVGDDGHDHHFGGILGLDVITWTMLGASITALTFGVINNDELDEIEAKVDRIPISP